MGFNRNLRFVRAGEPVTQSVTNRAVQTLNDNVNYLYDLIRSATVGSAIYARAVLLDASTYVGAPVYFRQSTQQFELGLAALADEAQETAESALVWGVVSTKTDSTSGDVLLFGMAEIDLETAVGGTVAPGLYYLSSATAGRLTATRPGISVPVLQALPDGQVFVRPNFVDLLDRHQHYRFDLTCRPAGTHTPPGVGEVHVITDADTSLPGWLPADDPSFDGLAPTGAKFGYNLSEHPGLANVWPPLPAGAWLEWDRGLDTEQGYQGTPDGLVVFDRNGIWWMTDCQGDVPWPADLDTTLEESESASASDCPREGAMTMSLAFSRTLFAAENAVVTSLRSRTPSVLRIYTSELGDTEGTSGALWLDLDLSLLVHTEDTAHGYQVFKTFDATAKKFFRGPVVSGVYAGSSRVTITGDATMPRDPAEPDGDLMYVGAIGVDVRTSVSYELGVDLVRVDGVTQDFVDQMLFLGMPAERAVSLTGRIDVPGDLDLTDPTFQLRLRLLGRVAGVLPDLTLTIRRVPRPADGLDTPLDLPDETDDVAVDIVTTATLASADQYVEALSDAVSVAAGDILFYTLARAADDAYAGVVGVLQQTGVLAGTLPDEG